MIIQTRNYDPHRASATPFRDELDCLKLVGCTLYGVLWASERRPRHVLGAGGTRTSINKGNITLDNSFYIGDTPPAPTAEGTGNEPIPAELPDNSSLKLIGGASDVEPFVEQRVLLHRRYNSPLDPQRQRPGTRFAEPPEADASPVYSRHASVASLSNVKWGDAAGSNTVLWPAATCRRRLALRLRDGTLCSGGRPAALVSRHRQWPSATGQRRGEVAPAAAVATATPGARAAVSIHLDKTGPAGPVQSGPCPRRRGVARLFGIGNVGHVGWGLSVGSG